MELKDSKSILVQSLKSLSNSVSAASFAVEHLMKPALAKFIGANAGYSFATPEEYVDIANAFLISMAGKPYIAWFIRSTYNSDDGKYLLVYQVLSHA